MNEFIPDASGGSLWASGAGVLAGLLWLRKFLSTQGVEMKKDAAESSLMKTLQEERDKAMAAAEKAWATRAEDAKMIGELTSEVKASRQLIDTLHTQLREVRDELHTVSNDLKTMRENRHEPDAWRT